MGQAAGIAPGRVMSGLRLARFAGVVAAALIVLIGPQLAWLALTRGRPSPIARCFHRILCWAIGIRIEIVGRDDALHAPPALIVANHLSWTDILVIGATLDATFVAKSDVRGWPLLGPLAALNPTLFVTRGARGAARDQVRELAQALARGHVALFPEGTTSNGRRLLPFRPTLFAAAGSVPVRPVSLCYMPIGRRDWLPGELEDIAWDGDKTFLPHFRMMIARGGIRCRVVLHPLQAPHADRKQLAARCHALIAGGLTPMIGGAGD